MKFWVDLKCVAGKVLADIADDTSNSNSNSDRVNNLNIWLQLGEVSWGFMLADRHNNAEAGHECNERGATIAN